jgi:hypothetical protein
MKRRIPLSPTQSAAFAMGRALIVFDSWSRGGETALDVERAMLIDFAVQHPRSVRTLVPELDAVIRAHGLQKHDLSDAFAERHFGVMRERFLAVIADLIARDLLVEAAGSGSADQLTLRATEAGRITAGRFSSALSLGLRAMCSVLSDAWRRRNVRDLATEIRKAIPDESQFAADLREPFARWLVEAD